VGTARRPITGRDRVARYLTGGVTKIPGDLDFTYAEVNGAPGYLVAAAGRVLGLITVSVQADRITAIHIVANPEKLTFASAQLSQIG
jgi:RNA polymerase sigma-70 factor (ECF subfamily)